MAILGIDLGTTNSLAVVWRRGRVELIPSAAGGFHTPSAVSIDENGTVLVGKAAQDRLISHPDRSAARFKQYMGADKVFSLGGKSFRPEELSALVFRRLQEDAKAYLGEPVEKAVISVPAYFAEAQRAATKRAGALAGMKVERLVNEPSAAAVAAHVHEGEDDKVCLVFDLGGGTLDVFRDAGLSLEELDELVLVGGSSHMPSVRQYIAQVLGREPVEDTRPDTAIALGAGICAGMKARAEDLRELVLTDVCPFILGVATFNEADPRRTLMTPLIERNSVLPTSKVDTFYTIRDNQNKVDVEVYQGENPYCDNNRLLGKLTLPVLPAPRGKQSVQIRFTYDINGLLEVEVVNQNGQNKSLVLKNWDMDQREVERRLKELPALKLHPRDQEVPRALLARAERLYTMTVGGLRAQVEQMLTWYQRCLATQETIRVAKATRRMEGFLNSVESYLGQDLLEGPLFSQWEENE